MSNFLSISNERGHFDYSSLSEDFEWKPYVEIALIYQVLIKQCLKKVFPTSNDFVPNGSNLLKSQVISTINQLFCIAKSVELGFGNKQVVLL